MNNSKEHSRQKKKRVTFQLDDYRIPREAYVHGFELKQEWATPTVYQRAYPNAEMTATGSRVCTGPSQSTSTFMLGNQTMMEMINGTPMAWQQLLTYIREELPKLIPSILSTQAQWLDHIFGETLFPTELRPSHDAFLVLKAYQHNVRTCETDFAETLPRPTLDAHRHVCQAWAEHQDIDDLGSCPMHASLLKMLLTKGPGIYVDQQIDAWESIDLRALLPRAAGLPEAGPDLESIGVAGAWQRLWWGERSRPSSTIDARRSSSGSS